MTLVREEPVVVYKNGKVAAIAISAEFYRQLAAKFESPLEAAQKDQLSTSTGWTYLRPFTLCQVPLTSPTRGADGVSRRGFGQ